MVAETRGEEASTQAQAARTAAAGGWSGPAAAAFDAAVAGGRSRIDALVAVIPDIPGPLLGYADTLERLRAEYVQVQHQAQDLARQIRVAPPATPGTDTMGQAYFAASDRLDQILTEAAAADEQVAGQVTAIAGRFSDAETSSRQAALTVALAPVGLGLAAQLERIEAEVGPSTVGTVGKVFGRVLGPVGAGLGQAVQDEENPNYSTAERIGRATGRAIFAGVPATAVGALAAVPGAALGAVVGGPVGAFGGAVGGAYVGSTVTTDVVNQLPFTDDLIDDTGEVFDWFGEQMRSVQTHDRDGN